MAPCRGIDWDDLRLMKRLCVVQPSLKPARPFSPPAQECKRAAAVDRGPLVNGKLLQILEAWLRSIVPDHIE
eukprot:6209275-Amphidinium_carterae.1